MSLESAYQLSGLYAPRAWLATTSPLCPYRPPRPTLPEFEVSVLTIRYGPDKNCLELKSLKEYLQSYRNLGIFQENIVNQVLEDVVRWAKPEWAEVKGDFRPRGGISTVVVARWPRPKKGNHP